MNLRGFLTGAVVAVLLSGCDRVMTAEQQERAIRACLDAQLQPVTVPYAFSRGKRIAAVQCEPWVE